MLRFVPTNKAVITKTCLFYCMSFFVVEIKSARQESENIINSMLPAAATPYGMNDNETIKF